MTTMRVLLLGCPGKGLYGVRRSLERVRDALKRHADTFVCKELYEGVTAAMFTAALEQLCEHAQEGEAVVIVYVGHGKLFDNDEVTGEDEAPPPRYLQVLVPTDICESRAEECRAISGLDLARTLEALDLKTGNVTLVLDCCHAVGIAAGINPHCAISQDYNDRLMRKLGAAKEKQRIMRSGGREEGPIRLLGSSTLGRAYEVKEPEGWIGAFSKAFAEELEQAPPGKTPWWGLAVSVQARLKEISGYPQWIGLEGPRERIIFTRIPAPLPAGGFACGWSGERLVVQAGQVYGFGRGDRFAIFDGAGEGKKLLGTAEIEVLFSSRAELGPFSREQGGALPPGAHAVCVRPKTSHALLVMPAAEELKILEPPLPGWVLAARMGVARIQSKNGRYELCEESGDRLPVVSVGASDPDAREALRRGLIRIGVWLRICAAVLKEPWRPRVGEFDLRFTPSLDKELNAGEILQVRAEHQGELCSNLHCAVFRVAADRTITHLTKDAVHGVPLRICQPHVFGRGELAPERGFRLDWSSVDPRHGAREEWLLFFVSPRPVLLHDLETAVTALPPPVRYRGENPRGAAEEIRCYAVKYRLRPALNE